MKITVKQMFKIAFPNVEAYFNFLFAFIFTLICNISSPEYPLRVLISGFGAIYCVNEWARQVRNR